MAIKSWNGSNADWYANSGGDWSPNGAPSDDDVVLITKGEVQVGAGDAAITVSYVTLTGGELAIEGDAGGSAPSLTVDDAFTLSGSASLSFLGAQGAASGDETISVGSLTNASKSTTGLTIGNRTLQGVALLQVNGNVANSVTITIQGASDDDYASLTADDIVSTGTFVVAGSGASAASDLFAYDLKETAGVIEGFGTITAKFENSGGTLVGGVLGGAMGVLTLAGSYTQSKFGDLQTDITTSGASLVAVDGALDLPGGLLVELASDFTAISTAGTQGSVSGSNSKILTLSGTLAQVNSDLALLSLNDPRAFRRSNRTSRERLARRRSHQLYRRFLGLGDRECRSVQGRKVYPSRRRLRFQRRRQSGEHPRQPNPSSRIRVRDELLFGCSHKPSN